MRATELSAPGGTTMGAPAPRTPARRGMCQAPRPSCPPRWGGVCTPTQKGAPGARTLRFFSNFCNGVE